MRESSESAGHLVFVFSQRDCELLTEFYADAACVRVPLQNAEKLLSSLPRKSRKWIDAEVDGMKPSLEETPYRSYIERFKHHSYIVDEQFQSKPISKIVQEFTNSVLDACSGHKPSLISVPQLPMVVGNARNKINRELAKAAAVWATAKNFSGTLILPVIFTHQDQLSKKTTRNPKVALVRQCYVAANAKGVWIVDSSLMDQEGTRTLDNRFKAIIDLHQEINEVLPSTSIVGGPYWGLNLLLWSKGLIKYPAISLGNRYRYHLPGGHAQQANNRVALSSLKRWVVVKPELRDWLANAQKALPPADPAHLEFADLAKRFSSLLHSSNSRQQICRSYRNWVDSLASVPQAGRALTLYQQLSSAYVLGKGLMDLPEEGPAKRPERIAQQLMLFCL
jgi:hypothetical protein